MLPGDPDDDSDDICQALYVNNPSTELGVGSFFLQEKNTASDATVKKERNVLSVFIIRLDLKFGLKFVARQGGGGGGGGGKETLSFAEANFRSVCVVYLCYFFVLHI